MRVMISVFEHKEELMSLMYLQKQTILMCRLDGGARLSRDGCDSPTSRVKPGYPSDSGDSGRLLRLRRLDTPDGPTLTRLLPHTTPRPAAAPTLAPIPIPPPPTHTFTHHSDRQTDPTMDRDEPLTSND